MMGRNNTHFVGGVALVAALTVAVSGCASSGGGSQGASHARVTGVAAGHNASPVSTGRDSVPTSPAPTAEHATNAPKASYGPARRTTSAPADRGQAVSKTRSRSTPEADKHSLSPQEQNAVESAKQYLGFSAFSRHGLIDQLSSRAGDGYPQSAATKAVDSLHVNWNTQAVKAAKQYLETSAFSRAGLIGQLDSRAGAGFTHSQAVYGVTHSGADWNAEAVEAAKQYLSMMHMSKSSLIAQLESTAGSGFTHSQAVYGAGKAYK